MQLVLLLDLTCTHGWISLCAFVLEAHLLGKHDDTGNVENIHAVWEGGHRSKASGHY